MQLVEIRARSQALEKREARLRVMEQELKEKERQMDIKFAEREGALRATEQHKNNTKEVYSEEMLKKILENQENMVQRLPVQALNVKRSRSPKNRP